MKTKVYTRVKIINDDNWEVFSTEILLGTYKIKVIDISAQYAGTEQLDLGNNHGIVSAEKIEYSIDLNFPDLANPFLPNKQNYIVNVWFAKNLGIVKVNGVKFFTNFISGEQINLNDTLFVENQLLK